MSAFGMTMAVIAAFQAGQFNLECTGQEWDRLQGGRAKPYSTTLRIDLVSNRWCRDDCAAGRPIISATDDRIELEKEEPPPTSRYLRVTSGVTINRIDGTYREFFSMIGSTVQQYRREAVCTAAPFTGLPAPRF